MRLRWQDFHYYSKKERRAIAILSAGLLLLIGGGYLWHNERTPLPYEGDKTALLDSFLLSSTSTASHLRSAKSYPTFSPHTSPILTPFPFDPNTADSITLSSLGLPMFVVRNILRYREKGGRFRTVEAVGRIYGMTEQEFLQLSPYIRIDSTQFARAVSHTEKTFQTDSLRTQKLPLGSQVEANRADTALLRQIPGVGSVKALQIVRYREQLGGFVRAEQIKEATELDSISLSYLFIEPHVFRPISVNRDGLDRLRAHPYLNFYQARDIIEYRKRKGKFSSIAQLSVLESFTEKDIEKLLPYLAF